jgi:hypothetical protein
MRTARPLSALALALALPACSAPDGLALADGDAGGAEAPAYVGAVAGTDAVVGAVSDGARVTFYLCGGPKSLATLTRWWRGDVDASGGYQLSAEDGEWTVRGHLGGGAGEIHTDDGRTLAFETRAVAGPVAGLYDALDGACHTGAVVGDLDGDGATRAQGVWCDGEGKFAQVTPIHAPLEVTTSGLEVRVDGYVKDMTLARVRWP